ncbi:MAG: cell wall-binding repeat-containing protein [Coriobacteriia bacterium]|nr:cell wall-binding repeat-containing protein [Coriobacteriia bacterium]
MNVFRKVIALSVATVLIGALVPFAAVAGGVQAQLIAPEDAYESDDTTTTATVYDPGTDGNTWTSMHTFHDLGEHDGVAEQSDYVKVTIEETGTPIFVENQRLGMGFYDPMLYIEDAVGTQLAYCDDSAVWWETYSSNLYYVAPAPGEYYIRAENNGDDSYAYLLHITLGDARRVAGKDRIATAVAVTSLMYDNTNSPSYGSDYGPNKILIANGYSPWDALAGGAAAAASLSDGSVLLLTHKDYLSETTYDEVVRLTESQYWNDNDNIEIFVLGGPAAVSDAVVADLETVPGVTNVERIAGADRFATAAEIATLTAGIDGVSSTAFVVSGYSWPDAIAAAPVAGFNASPVLMTKSDDVPDVTMDWIANNAITSVVVVGGTSVVGDVALDELRSAVGTANVEVLAGDTRYETARLVAQYGVDKFGMRDTTCQLVSGEAFPDALASAAMSAMTKAPTLLTKPGALHPEVIGFFEDSGSIGYNANLLNMHEGWGCWVIGGESAVSAPAYEDFRDLWMMFP